jgi:hypothetical protein
MKYRVQRDEQRLWISLTPWGRARELAAGLLLGAALGLAGLLLVFAPDLLAQQAQRPELLPSYAFAALFGASLLGVGLGARRAWGSGGVELDLALRLARHHVRRWPAGREVEWEAPLSAIKLDVQPGRVALRLDGGLEEVIARAWFGRGELDALARALREALVDTQPKSGLQ